MSTFRILAETLSEKNYFEVDEVEGLIETYFKIWISDIRNKELISDSIIRERSRVLSERDQLNISKFVVEKQLFDAELKRKQGRPVDLYWMSRAKFAFRVIKSKIVRCNDQLTNLKTAEKNRNIEMSRTQDRELKVTVFALLECRFGLDYTKALFDEALDILESNKFSCKGKYGNKCAIICVSCRRDYIQSLEGATQAQ